MTDRDRLIELIGNIDDIINSECTLDCEGCNYEKAERCATEILADYLLANGVIVAPMPMAEWLRKELTQYVHERCMEEL